MAKVPLTGSIEMFDGANSIYEVVVAEIGTPAGTTFDDILTFVKANVTIDYFDPAHRPNTLAELSQTSEFRGFPYAKSITLGFEGGSESVACSHGSAVFWTGTYVGSLGVGDILSVPVSGNSGYFKVISAEDASLEGDVILVDDDSFVISITDSPCSSESGIIHLCQNRYEILV